MVDSLISNQFVLVQVRLPVKKMRAVRRAVRSKKMKEDGSSVQKMERESGNGVPSSLDSRISFPL